MGANILQRFISILGTNVATLLLGVVITPILVRLLGVSLYGDYAFMLSVLGVTMILVNAGIFDGTRKYMAEKREIDNWPELVFGFYTQFGILLATVVAALFVVVSYFTIFEGFFGPEFTVYFYILSGVIIGRQVYSIVRGGLMGISLESQSEPLKILRKFLFAVLGLGLAYQGYGVVGVLVGHLIASLVTAVIGLSMLFQHLEIKSVISRVPDEFPRRRLISFNGFSVVLILLTASLYHVDIVLLRTFIGSEQTGYYRAALTVAQFLWFVPIAMQTIFLHSSSELWSEGESEKVSDLSSRATRYNLSLTLLIALGIAALSEDFVSLYFGPEFNPTITPLLLLLPGTLGFAIARPIFAVGQGKGDFRTLILATGTAAVINVVLNLLLIPQYGMVGAATATSVSYGSMLLFHLLAARRIGFNPLDNIRGVRIIVVAVLTCPIIFGLSSLLESASVALFIVPPIGFIYYLILTIRLRIITPEETEELVERVPSPLGARISQALHFIY